MSVAPVPDVKRNGGEGKERLGWKGKGKRKGTWKSVRGERKGFKFVYTEEKWRKK